MHKKVNIRTQDWQAVGCAMVSLSMEIQSALTKIAVDNQIPTGTMLVATRQVLEHMGFDEQCAAQKYALQKQILGGAATEEN